MEDADVEKLEDADLKILLSQRWDKLTKDKTFFEKDNCKRQPIGYVYAAKHERRLYCYNCQNIDFQNENGTSILTKSGDGEMERLPPHVGVYIVWGTWKTEEHEPST
ncbi:hypothetical protein N7499_003087 [Penicillium canescens]|uniref:Uncharacterized protein n=1 Tax=Penicillium canescens TaxID=5083 RepID=A0AAD6IAK3_PENCN|nr:uncharacterized protein N7446_011959 [Penicillium canescens]KAJ6039106.1 hypothetical protein N7460_007138 [Penicillium canescens]KAJ6047125.1 hypothetical protein N7446_011959 [Penicillium canescens]KAJ6059877.1 hypothetical protein N7444_003516 [Penicillium canescens]KAJ6093756.1 hypothetical protein N7499_003087 [Penicillium canescens]KAJ6174450.1 hypothetical protein N7485_005516 [Penicillium canescens]